MVPGGHDLMRIKVETMWSRASFVLIDNALDFAVSTRTKITMSSWPRATVKLIGMGKMTSIGTKEWPGNYRANMELRSRLNI